VATDPRVNHPDTVTHPETPFEVMEDLTNTRAEDDPPPSNGHRSH
jgi:hypothetical protein